jgi:tRNA pseudouridine55 synthase
MGSQIFCSFMTNFANHGLMAVFKPKHVSSAGVVRQIRGTLERSHRERTGVKRKIKVGHGGTLDPLATGVLVIGVGKGTKMLSQYLTGSKEYTGVSKQSERICIFITS